MKHIIRTVEQRFSGETNVSISFAGQVNLSELKDADFDELLPGKSIIKCRHCGQWGARKCDCKYCGAAID